MNIEIPYEIGSFIYVLENSSSNYSYKKAKVTGYWWDPEKKKLIGIFCVSNTSILKVLPENCYISEVDLINHLLNTARKNHEQTVQLVEKQEKHVTTLEDVLKTLEAKSDTT